jgi:tetratricopeptide (TPR) repeat protein
MPPVILCTGFHRSATSVTAKWLDGAGFPMGQELVPSNISNPDGHFEDRRGIELHDAWLRRSGTDWLFHGEVPLAADAELTAAIQAYVGTRDADAAAGWGLKDPRLSLALPDWARVLGDRGRFVLVARHWAECAQSLYARHGRELAYKLPAPGPSADAHLRLWRQPTLAFESWLAYSRRMLAFLATHTGRHVLVTSRAIERHHGLPPAAAAHLGVEFSGGTDLSLRDGLLKHAVDQARLPDLPPWLLADLDDTWEQILALATFRTDDEEPAFVRRTMDDAERELLEGPLRRPRAPAPAAGGEMAGSLDAAVIAHLAPEARLRKRMQLAEIAQRAGEPATAAEWLQQALPDAGKQLPVVLHRLGDALAASGRPEEAINRFLEADAAGPRDAARIRAAQVAMQLQDWRRALDFVEPVLAAHPDSVDGTVIRARALHRLRGPESAAASLLDYPGAHAGLDEVMANLTMEFDKGRGQELYRAAVRAQLAQRDLAGWIAQIGRTFENASAWAALLHELAGHWREALGPDGIAQRLTPASPDA